MREATQDLGVVDPIRIPGVDPVRRLWRRAPNLARMFIGLAVLDLIVRAVGVIGPPLVLNPGQPLALVADVVPRTLWILLPAIVLIRRPDAWWSTPKLLLGSVTLALTMLVVAPLPGLLVSSAIAADVDFVPVSLVLSALFTVLSIAAWLFIGSGFSALRQRPATPSGRVLSSLIVASAIISAALGAIAIASSTTGRDDDLAGISAALNLLTVIAGLFVARAYWIVARGVADPLRPARATWIGGIAGLVIALSGIAGSAMSAWVTLTQPVPDVVPGALITLVNLAGWLGAVIAPGLLVLAIAIGLIDPDRPVPVESPIT
jgi:hypothetical protein